MIPRTDFIVVNVDFQFITLVCEWCAAHLMTTYSPTFMLWIVQCVCVEALEKL